ncbi:MAG: hypothetical protein AUG46_10255 [Acidobacteria bacterium 13_1_20CM_3_58_11]|nr:MAG: hypothetical protein AUG46_10255 [Acidobacteria bacterium 13_1_20CM_3_58_11]
MKPNFVLPVQSRTLSGHGIKIEIRGNRRLVVDIACGARQAVEKGQYESADAMEFNRFCEHIVQLGKELLPRRRKCVGS